MTKVGAFKLLASLLLTMTMIIGVTAVASGMPVDEENIASSGIATTTEASQPSEGTMHARTSTARNEQSRCTGGMDHFNCPNRFSCRNVAGPRIQCGAYINPRAICSGRTKYTLVRNKGRGFAYQFPPTESSPVDAWSWDHHGDFRFKRIYNRVVAAGYPYNLLVSYAQKHPWMKPEVRCEWHPAPTP